MGAVYATGGVRLLCSDFGLGGVELRGSVFSIVRVCWTWGRLHRETGRMSGVDIYP